MKIEETERGVIPMLATFIVVLIIGIGIYGYGNIKEKKADDVVVITIPPVTVAATSTTEVSTSTATTTATTTVKTTKSSGYVRKAYTKGERHYIDFDEVTFVTCESPNGNSCLLNTDSTEKTYEVSADAKIKLMGTFQLYGLIQQGTINWQEFMNVFKTEEDYRKGNPWDITLKGDMVVEIKENFRP